jgi:hypothetical protein
MNVPPPNEPHFVQMLTKEAQKAVSKRSGEAYQDLVKEIKRLNQDCFESEQEVEAFLQLYIWPPIKIEGIYYGFPHGPHIPKFPSVINVHGKSFQVLITDSCMLEEMATRASARIGFVDSFGSIEELNELKNQYIAEGNSSETFERKVLSVIKKSDKAVRRKYLMGNWISGIKKYFSKIIN